jgi:glycosyltransferase involved in cell wall biosynthesis
MNLQQNVLLFDEVPQSILAKHMRKSVALVLYSDYETFGCVIIEANACGVPVIVSDIPVFHENVEEGRNGYFADKDNVISLADKMLLAINDRSNLHHKELAVFTHENYRYSVIGEKISQWYRNVLNEN